MKKTLTTFCGVLFLTSLFSQPINDDCSGLIDLGIAPICPVLDTFDNVDATTSIAFSNANDNIPTCYTSGIINRDVWFSFTVPASGDIVDFTVILTGVDGPNGSIVQPQIAVYRGECLLDELQELECAESALGETTLEMDLLQLTPGLPYFLRISDWSASANPNSGDFVLCIKEFDPIYNMGDDDFSESCGGTLFDSGGPDGNYSNNENLTFTICPQETHQCISIDLVEFNLETTFDFLSIYEGMNVSGQQITNFTSSGSNIEIQTSSNCITLLFESDVSANDTGFELTWQCSPTPCTVPPPSNCGNPTVVAALPYSASNLTTCSMVNNITNSPCGDDEFLNTDDVVFTYTSPGDECISIAITGSNEATGVAIFDNCPNLASNCLAQAGGGFGDFDPVIPSTYLELPGTYYIVVDNGFYCTDFNIDVQQVTCPVVFPSPAFCEDALPLNGCQANGNTLPAIISVAPGLGDENAIIEGVNDGCWGAFDPPNFSWFIFQAQVDGEFGFIVESYNPDEASDIDFQVWGPIETVEEICDFTLENQPERSSYAAGADPTGLANIHPITNLPVTDVCEDAGGDDFVSTLPVIAGKWYVVLINDYGEAITSGAVSIDFGGTTQGVLDPFSLDIEVSNDTFVCPGQSVQLMADGGEVYDWFPNTGLSCSNCPNPIATVNSETNYNVAIHTVCQADTFQVKVGILTVDAGPDLTVCLGEQIQILAGSNFANIQWEWAGETSFLSCTDCADPILTANSAGDFEFIVIVVGPNCTYSDTMMLHVLPNAAPSYQISEDKQLCLGETVSLGGQATSGVDYSWTSIPAGFFSDIANPIDTPTQSIVYYLELNNGDCPLPSFDSVVVVVSEKPIIQVANDMELCLGESTVLGSTIAESGVIYEWSPSIGLNNPNIANPIASPAQSTQYILTANRNGCLIQDTVQINVIIIDVNVTSPDTVGICAGTSVTLSATSLPNGTTINWTPNDGSLSDSTGVNVIASPATPTSYIATVSVPGCIKMDTVYIGVDSLPYDLDIMPLDSHVCKGEIVYLTSTTYEPSQFPSIVFQWLEGNGQLTPDSLYNMVVQPDTTTEYQRIATNGFCSDTSSVTVFVNTIPQIEITPSIEFICQGESVQLQISSDSVLTSFSWSPSESLSCTDCSSPTAMPDTSTTYTVAAQFGEQCPGIVTASVTIEVLPGFELIVPDMVEGTQGELVTIEATVLPMSPTYSYEWRHGSTGIGTEASVVVSSCFSTTYEVIATDENGCTQTDSVFLNVTNGFTINKINYFNLSQNTTEIFEGQEMGFSVTTDPTVLPGANYEWYFNGQLVGTTTDSIFESIHAPEVDSDSLFKLKVIITSSEGCQLSDSILVNILNNPVEMPNAFSPNNDGTNDRFFPVTKVPITVLEFKIWNRWGDLVYDNEDGIDGWDGQQKSEDSPSDVYVYFVVFEISGGTEGAQKPLKGDVTLLR